MKDRRIWNIIIAASAVMLACNLSGCGGKKEHKWQDQHASDEMWKDRKQNEEVYMFRYDDTVYMADSIYEARYGFDYDSVRKGGFYRVTADITYLNGGIAGYVDYPEIESVHSIEEVSPFDLKLPSITEKQYGLVRIGDYADGDILVNEYGLVAVWKDGDWIWKYERNNSFRTEDGSTVYMASGISKEEAQKGIADGVLSCEDYFVVPASKADGEKQKDESIRADFSNDTFSE